MSSFFTVPASQRKRKRQDGSSALTSKRRQLAPKAGKQSQKQPASKTKRAKDDESISGSESEDGDRAARTVSEDESVSESANETAAEKRLRLAEQYLEDIRAEVGAWQEVGFDAEQVDRDLIATRLKEDVAEEKGRLYRHIAEGLDLSRVEHSFFRADTLAVTGVALCSPYIYTVSKDIALIKWELPPPPKVTASHTKSKSTRMKPPPTPTRRKPKQLLYTKGNKNRSKDPKYEHHTSAILCVAASADGKLVVTGGADRRLIAWDAETLAPLKVFTQHRDAVTGLAFRGKMNQLFSASKDRTVKVWSLDELAYVETLFGHQDEVVDVSAVGGGQERCVSVGARDRTARLWKVVEESQLVFRGGGVVREKDRTNKTRLVNGTSVDDHGAGGTTTQSHLPSFSEGSLDRVVQLDSQLFVTGSDSGALSLFALHKKKPLHVVPLAHGCDPPPAAEEASAEVDIANKAPGQPTPRWITALACVPYSDLLVSGSWDGFVRLWRISGDQKRIECVGALGNLATTTVAAESQSLEPRPELPDDTAPHPNGTSATTLPPTESHANGLLKANGHRHNPLEPHTVPAIATNADTADVTGVVKGVINDLVVLERGDRGRDGVCIVAGVGTEPRLGRWFKRRGRNGCFLFDVPRRVVNVSAGEEDASGRPNGLLGR